MASDGRDRPAVCNALRQIVKEQGYTQEQAADLMEMHQNGFNRYLTMTEPKPSFLARVEEKLGVKPGTVLMRAGLVDWPTHNIRELLASDPKLIPSLQRLAVQSYDVWRKVSAEERKKDS